MENVQCSIFNEKEILKFEFVNFVFENAEMWVLVYVVGPKASPMRNRKESEVSWRWRVPVSGKKEKASGTHYRK